MRQLIAQERQLLAQRQGMKETETRAEKYSRLEKLAQDDPEAALQELGLNYDTLTDRRLQNPEERARVQLEKKIEALEKRLGQQDEEKTQAKTADEMTKARAEIERIISSSDDFELASAYGDHDLIFQTAALYTQKTGNFVTLEDAAKWVEEERETQLDKILESKKAKSRFAAKTAPTNPEGQQAAKDAISEISTGSATSSPRTRTETLSSDLTGGSVPQTTAGTVAALRAKALDELKRSNIFG
jgi:hypothetical protein